MLLLQMGRTAKFGSPARGGAGGTTRVMMMAGPTNGTARGDEGVLRGSQLRTRWRQLRLRRLFTGLTPANRSWTQV